MDSLNQLIASLSRTEKRYIKLSIKKNYSEKQSSYLKLFDFIIAHPNSNNSELKLSFKNEKWHKNIPVLKNQLKQIILKSLRNYNAENSPEFKIINHLQNADILLNKSILKEALNEIKKAEELIKKHEKIFLSAYAYEIRLKYYHTLKDTVSLSNELQSFSGSLPVFLSELNHYFTAQAANINFFNHIFLNGTPRNNSEYKQFKAIIDDIPENSNLFKVNYIKSNLLSVYYGMKDDYEKSKAELEVLIKLFDSNPLQKEQNILNYISIINNLAIVSEELNEHKKTDRLLSELEQLERTHKFTSTADLLFLKKNYIGLAIYIYEKRNKQKIITEKIAPQITAYLNTVTEYGWYELYFLYALASAHFKLNEFLQTKQLLTRILNTPTAKNVANDILVFSKLLLAIVYYEMNDVELMHSFIHSTDYFLSKTHKNYQTEILIIKALKSLLKHSDKSIIFKRLKNDLIQLTADNPLEKKALAYFNAIEWSEKHLTN